MCSFRKVDILADEHPRRRTLERAKPAFREQCCREEPRDGTPHDNHIVMFASGHSISSVPFTELTPRHYVEMRLTESLFSLRRRICGFSIEFILARS